MKRLAELHGGTATAASEGPNQGSTFTVRLPDVPAPSATRTTPSDEHRDAPRRVLLIEDNDDSREMLKATLEMSGHTVYEVSDGAKGIEAGRPKAKRRSGIDVHTP